MDSDFKAPDVVFIYNEGLRDLSDSISAQTSIHDDCPDIMKEILTSYTLTTTAETNTQKAVCDAIAEAMDRIDRSHQASLFGLSYFGARAILLDCLAAHQPLPRPTEASSE